MRRRLLLIAAGFLALAFVLVATLPFWLGAVAASLGRSRGLTFARYERLGYARFALHDVEFRRDNVRVTVSRAEADTPLLWGWRHWRSGDQPVVAERWSVAVTKKPADAPAPPRATESGWVPLHGKLRQIAAQLDRWLPEARTGAGVVRWPGGELTVASARWAKRELAFDALAFRAYSASGSVAFPGVADTIRVALTAPENEASAKLESRGGDVRGELALWGQPATLAAKFGPRGWLPPEASLRAENWSLPGGRLKLGELYGTVRGRAQVDWRADRFVVDVVANGTPVEGKKAPPLTVTLRGQGDANAFRIEALDAALPGITTKLSAPVTIDRAGKLAGEGARFDVQAALEQQPWFPAGGKLTGTARVVSAAGGAPAVPVVEFQLQGRDVRATDVALSGITAEGRLAWPKIEITRGEIVGGEGERLAFSGGWDVRAKEILRASVSGQLRRASLARWLPKQPEFDVVKLRAQASGPIESMVHSGQLEADEVKFSGVNAAKLHAEWQGSGLGADTLTVRATSGATTLQLSGALDLLALRLTALDLTRGGAPLLRLSRPAELRWKPALALDGLHLAGPEGSLDAALAWGESGRIELAARNLSSSWLGDLVPLAGPAWRLDLLAATGTWARGPMTFSVTGGATLDLGEGRSAAVHVAARGAKDGIRIEALRATESDANVVNATGRLPIVVQPGATPLTRIDPAGALELEASAVPNAAFWQKLGAASGLQLKAPEAALRVHGTWQRPQGEVRVKAGEIAFDAKRFQRELPKIEAVDVQLTGEPDGITLTNFAFAVEGQAVRARGRLPVADGAWAPLFKDPLAALQRGADVRLEVPDAEIAVFTRFLPAVLAPKGRVQLNVGYKDGNLDGFLRLTDAATRPLGPLGVLQEISADIALAGRKLELRGVTAKSGGQPVTLTGVIELPATFARGVSAASPRFDLALNGENLPFVRQTGTLVRGDLDLALQTQGNSTVARISGQVRLRDSLFLQDVRAFLPRGGGGGGATRRPPYFEVTTPPLNAWILAIDVVGERFLRLRTPVFAGTASARFRLGGTLGEPRAVGEVVIDEGRVMMPFAGFDVRQGAVRLTESNPYAPAIYLRATGRRYGYDLTMEIEGDATSPTVEFTSSPGLDSEQVLLMVMTGAAPKNEVAKSATQRAASLGYFLGKSLLGSVTGDSADAERLSITAGEKISEGGNETYDIEYKLNNRWAVVAERSEFDEYNAGFKWRVFPRETETEKRARKITPREGASDAKK